MHELGIVRDLLNIALDYATSNHAARIRQLNVQVSAAADESEDSLRFHFDHLTRGTMAEGARLNIERVPVQANCLECEQDFAWSELGMLCPHCSSPRVRPLLEDGFKLTSIEIE